MNRALAAAAAAAALLLVGCNPRGPAAVDAPDPSAAVNYQRLVSLAPHLTEIVFAVGAADRLVGVVAFSDYPAGARDIPLVGDAFRVDMERIASLAPDLILAWEGGNPEPVIVQLEQRGYRVLRLASNRLGDVAAQMRLIGDLTGNAATARRAAQGYSQGLAALRSEHGQRATVRVFYQVSADPLYTVGGTHTISQIIELCGGANIFAELDALAPVVAHEAVLARDPQVILAARSGPDPLAGWRRWPELGAVKHHHLALINGDLVARAGPRLLQGAESVCEVLDAARTGVDPESRRPVAIIKPGEHRAITGPGQ